MGKIAENIYKKKIDGHRIILTLVLCLFGLCLVFAMTAPPKRSKKKAQHDSRVYLVHSDELKYDQWGTVPGAQIVKGKVHFTNDGAQLWCDSAYFFQEQNSVEAFGHVRFKQGDTLSLTCKYGQYDGQEQMMRARHNVVLKHRTQTLYTDSLDYDRIYENAYFFEGGKLVDGKDELVSDWGQYNTQSRKAAFFYNVRMRSNDDVIHTDTLFYDTRTSLAHVTGPSKIVSGDNVIHTADGYFNSKTDLSQLFGRSTIVNKEKTITGDSLFHDNATGLNEGFGNVVYKDTVNKNQLLCDHLFYNDKTGYGYATRKALMKDYSQQDTLYVHADTLKLYTFNIDTDSVYRMVHGYRHVKAYRKDVQALCDSMVFSSLDSCLTMYQDPVAWSGERQILGEQIKIFMNDSTVRKAEVIGQALSVEKVDDKDHFNQVASRRMDAFFVDGAIRKTEAVGNVRTVFYPQDSKDSTLTGLNYLETDTLRMFMSPERKLQKIWTSKATGTMYPMTQIPPQRYHLDTFEWFENLRPVGPADVFVWRGKGTGSELKKVKRQEAPLQTLPALGSMTTTAQDAPLKASEKDAEAVSEKEKTVTSEKEQKAAPEAEDKKKQ